MDEKNNLMSRSVNRRSLLQKGVMAAGAATIGAGLIGGKTFAFAQDSSSRLTKGDVAILRFLNALAQVPQFEE
jgi:hypothetical protein